MTRFDWYECNVKYNKTSNGEKPITEVYLLQANSYADAEDKLIHLVYTYNDIPNLEILDIKKRRFLDVIIDGDSERVFYYKARVLIYELDEKSGTEKVKSSNVIVKANNLAEAMRIAEDSLKETIEDCELHTIGLTNIVEAITYTEYEPALQSAQFA